MNREERELIKLTINRGASPFWPQHRDHLFGRNVVAPVWYAALATTVAAALAAAVAVALAAALAAALDAALADAAIAAALGTAHTAAVSSIARRVGKGRVRDSRSHEGVRGTTYHSRQHLKKNRHAGSGHIHVQTTFRFSAVPMQVQTMSTTGSDLRKTFKDVSWTYYSAKKKSQI